MKNHLNSYVLFACLLGFLTIPFETLQAETTQEKPAQAKSTTAWKTINTTNLSEWETPGKWWKTEKGILVGESKGNKNLPAADYLMWKGSIKGSFELRLDYRIISKASRDAGIYFRVERPVKKGAGLSPAGYQIELDTCNLYGKNPRIKEGKNFGKIYDGKRNRKYNPGFRVTMNPDGTETSTPLAKKFNPITVFKKPPQWNHCRVLVEGDRIRLYVNGLLASEVIDQDAKKKSTGDGIALQFRPQQAHRFEIKNLEYRLLTTPAETTPAKPVQVKPAEAKSTTAWKTINTTNLSEWETPGKWWKTEKGILIGESKGDKNLPKVDYLMWKGSIKGSFELRLDYRIIAKVPMDSGINFRVERPVKKGVKDPPSYQAELDTCNLYSKKKGIINGKNFGNIYDGKRNRMYRRGSRVTIKPDGTKTSKPLAKKFNPATVFKKPPQWNRCRILVEGNRIRLYMNDVLANEIIDQDTKKKANGDGIALQFRPQQAQRFEIKNLEYRLLNQK